MANDNESVDSNGNSADLRPRRSNRAKGKQVAHVEDSDDNIIVNNVPYKVGDFAYYMDKKQDVFRIGLIEEFKFQKREKLSSKKAEISVKQFYRLEEIPASVLSNQGEYDTHVMPPNFPEWLRQREIFISDNALLAPVSSLRGLCNVRHFPDLNHAMALFSTTQAAGQSPRPVDHHALIFGKDSNPLLPVPKHRDDNTFFYVYSYNPRARKLAVTYLEIRVGPAYQAELPDMKTQADKVTDVNYNKQWEQLMWTPNQIPEEVFELYKVATLSIACFSGFGGGVDDSASIENGRKIASHMLTQQKALDCLHRCQYNMEKAMEVFAENSLPETNKIPFLWTDEDHILFDESVKIHGKNFLRIKEDKRNKKSRMVGDYVTFYYYWKKNRPKNRKYTVKKGLRSRGPNQQNATGESQDSIDTGGKLTNSPPFTEGVGGDKSADRQNEHGSGSPGADTIVEQCGNCKATLNRPQDKDVEDKTANHVSERMRTLCDKCQSYFRRYGYQRPLEPSEKHRKGSDDDDEEEEAMNGFDEDDEDDDGDPEDDDEDDAVPSNGSPSTAVVRIKDGAADDGTTVIGKGVGVTSLSLPIPDNSNKSTLAINKYDFDQEDENVEDLRSLLQRNQAKHCLLREDGKGTVTGVAATGNAVAGVGTITKSSAFAGSSKSVTTAGGGGSSLHSSSHKQPFKISGLTSPLQQTTSGPLSAGQTQQQQTTPKLTASVGKSPATTVETQGKVSGSKRSSSSSSKSKSTIDGGTAKKRKLDSSVFSSTAVGVGGGSAKQFHESLKSNIPSGPFGKGTNDQQASVSTGGQQKKPVLPGQAEMAAHFDSNSSSSTSSSSNDSSSSSDDADSPPGKPTTTKYCSKTAVDAKDTQTAAEPSYTQMITAVPNLPGVCAVTEPMPQLVLTAASTDLPTARRTPVPLAAALDVPPPSLPSGSTPTKAAASKLSSSSSPQTSLQLPTITAGPSLSFTEGYGGPLPEDTVLNLVKKRCEQQQQPLSGQQQQQQTEHSWTTRHESPSKLVHYRGDSGATDASVGNDGVNNCSTAGRPMIGGCEVVHNSIFGHCLRTVGIRQQQSLSSDEFSCARNDLQHTRMALTATDIEKRRQYHAERMEEAQNQQATATQEQCASNSATRLKQQGSMPPPVEKAPHQPSSVKQQQPHFGIPPLTTHPYSGGGGGSSSTTGQLPSPAHSRKVQTATGTANHALRSPSPASSRAQQQQQSFPGGGSAASAAAGGMMRAGMHGAIAAAAMGSSSSAGNSGSGGNMRPNMQMAGPPNNNLMMDYNNMNKVLNDMFISQALHNYKEEIHKQEQLKMLMMSLPSLPPAAAMRQMQWAPPPSSSLPSGPHGDQRDRFPPLTTADWLGTLQATHGPAPASNDILQAEFAATLLRAFSQSQVAAVQQNRPRSAAGLNLSSAGGTVNPQDKQSSSGRTSANHAGDYGARGGAVGGHASVVQDQLAADGPEVTELIRALMDSQMAAAAHPSTLFNMINYQKGPPPPSASTGLHLQQQQPPAAHSLSMPPGAANLFGLGPPPPPQMHPQTILSQMQNQPSSSVKAPTAPTSYGSSSAAAAAAAATQRQNADMFQMLTSMLAFSQRTPPR